MAVTAVCSVEIKWMTRIAKEKRRCARVTPGTDDVLLVAELPILPSASTTPADMVAFGTAQLLSFPKAPIAEQYQNSQHKQIIHVQKPLVTMNTDVRQAAAAVGTSSRHGRTASFGESGIQT